jgi:hypothetical protein
MLRVVRVTPHVGNVERATVQQKSSSDDKYDNEEKPIAPSKAAIQTVRKRYQQSMQKLRDLRKG